MKPRFRWPRRLSGRLVLLLLVAVAVVFLAVGSVTRFALQSQLDSELDTRLDRAVQRVVAPPAGSGGAQQPEDAPGATSGQGPGGGPGTPGASEFELHAVIEDGAATTAVRRDESGQLAELSTADAEALATLATDADPATGTPSTRARTTEADLEVGRYRIHIETADDGRMILVGVPTEQRDSTLDRLDLALAASGIGALTLTAAGGALLVRRTLRPLDEVAAVASRIADKPLDHGDVELGERVPASVVGSGTEVSDVARALNALLDNVGGALETRRRTEAGMRRFVADASHELRTPLTAIRGYTELMGASEALGESDRQSLDRIRAQADRMGLLVEDLLLLARLDDEHARRADMGKADEVDLGEMVLEAAMDARAAAPEHCWSVQVPDEPVAVWGVQRHLAQLVTNLVSNAHKHTPAGTAVDLALTADGGRAVLEVRDEGPGIPESLRGTVFDRFTRADQARTGGTGSSGLGLPIARAIARSHGGELSVDSSEKGTVFTLSLPLSGPQ